MNDLPLNSPSVGAHVWLESPLVEHGPLDRPKTSVPGQNLGTIVATEKPYLTMDHSLYTVKWGTGHVTKHYYKEMFCIGSFESAHAFLGSVASCKDAVLVQGPRGGFRRFTAHLAVGSVTGIIAYFKDQGSFFRAVIEPVLKRAGVTVNTIIET